MHRASFVAGAAAVCFAADAGAQTLYRCTLADGRTVYQDSKCEDTAKQRELAAPAAPAAPTAPAAPAVPASPQVGRPIVGRSGAPARNALPVNCPTRLAPIDPRTGVEEDAYSPTRRDLELVIDVYRSYPLCAAEVPGFTSAFGDAYRQWQQRYREAIGRYEGNPAARRMVECAHELSARRTAEDRTRDQGRNAQYCMQMLGPMLQAAAAQGRQ